MNSKGFLRKMTAVLLCAVLLGALIPIAASAALKVPEMKKATAIENGIKVTWNSVPDAVKYHVYRKTGDSGWEKVGQTTKTSYKDLSAKAGKTYTYTVRAFNAKGEKSGYDHKGVSAKWKKAEAPKTETKKSGDDGKIVSNAVATPKLKAISNKATGVNVTWNPVSGATSYKVYIMTKSGGGLSLVGTVPGSQQEYLDTSVTGGKKYTYTVRAYKSSEKSGYDHTGLSITYLKKPVITSANSATSGIKIVWDKVSGASEYWVYRNVGSGDTKIATTSSTSYIDKAYPNGVACTYKIRAKASDGSKSVLSSPSSSVTYTKPAAVKSLTLKPNAILVEWDSITGADHYKVSRKSGDSTEFQVIATVSDPTTEYLDDKVVNGETHTYRVRAYDSSDNPVGSFDTKGKSMTFYAAPTLIDCVRKEEGGDNGSLVTTWEAVEHPGGKYAVYRKVKPGSYVKIATVTGTSYTDTTMPSGTKCYYTVRCTDKDGNTISSFVSAGVGETSFMDKPVLVSAVSEKNKIVFTWKEVDKATDYHVYRKIKGEYTEFKPVTIVSGVTEYTDTDVVSGKTYIYTVATSDGSDDMSLYNTTGVSTMYYDVPKLYEAVNKKAGVKITWKAVDGISLYQIYRKTGSSDWTKIGTSSTTEYTDTNVVSNGHYIYTVSCLKNSKVVSGYDETGVNSTFYAPPKMKSVAVKATGVQVTWDRVEGISEYQVYRKLGDNDKILVGTVSGGKTTYLDTSAVSGKTYLYQVNCYKDSKRVSSWESGLSVTYIEPPVLTSVTSTKATKATVKWNTVTGAKNYAVYYRIGSSGWKKAATVGSDITSYEVTGLTSKNIYEFMVKSIAKDGTTSMGSNKLNCEIK